MAYVTPNFKTKKELKDAVKAGQTVSVFNPGLGTVPNTGWVYGIEGPHYPKPHTWDASVYVEDGRVTKVR